MKLMYRNQNDNRLSAGIKQRYETETVQVNKCQAVIGTVCQRFFRLPIIEMETTISHAHSGKVHILRLGGYSRIPGSTR